MRRIVSCGLSGPAIFFHIISNGTVFEKKNLLNIKYVFSIQILCENFLILRKIQRDNIINFHMSSRKVPVVLVRFQ